MSSTIKLDAKDKGLVGALEHNARASFAQIGRDIRTSKEVVSYRLQKLKEQKFVTTFRTLVNYYKLGYTCYNMLINLERLNHGKKEEIFAYLKANKNLRVDSFIQSRFDIEIIFWAKTSEDFRKFFHEFQIKFSSHITQKVLSVITEIHLYGHRYIHNQENSWHIYESDKQEKVDEIDYKIINTIRKDARMELIEIAKQTDLPISTTKYRLTQLKKRKIIVGYRASFDVGLIGYSKYRITVDLSDPTKAAAAATYLGSKPEVVRLHETIGSWDLMFAAHFKTIKELDEFLQKFQTVIPQIRDVDVLLLLD